MPLLLDNHLEDMDHLDLAGVMSAPPSYWQMPVLDTSAFDQQDAIYLSSSRQMLEPILEESSEDEESPHNSWSQFENNSTWSSESETGSVIRIEPSKDPDSISERDFACPAKRARRDEFIIGGPLTCQPLLDENSQLRKYQRNDFLNSVIDRISLNDTTTLSVPSSNGGTGSTGQRKRFDEFYSDMDSISCNSLSRSSSLIQFESLERQLLSEQSSSLGNSSPSLLSFEGGSLENGSISGPQSHRGSTGCLKRYESSDGRLHQTYYDLDKIDFGTNLHFTSTVANKSDSESSSDNSVASHKVLSATGRSHSKAFLKGGKSSVENLSEDSGYCENTYTVLRAKSKSIPSFEKFCEEDEFYDHSSVIGTNTNKLHKSHSKIQISLFDDTCAPKIDGKGVAKSDNENDQNAGDCRSEVDCEEEEEPDGDCWYSGDKNSRRSPSSSSPVSFDESSTNTSASPSCASASSFTWRPALASTNKENANSIPAPLHESPYRSSSLPDIRAAGTTFTPSDHPCPGIYYFNQQTDSSVLKSVATDRVASVPSDLDLIEDHEDSQGQSAHHHQQTNGNHQHRQRRSVAQRRHPLLMRRTLSASSSSDLDEEPLEESALVSRSSSWKRIRNSTSAERLRASTQSVHSLHSVGSGSGAGYMNASYNNLTLLDYSGKRRSNKNLSLVSEESSGNLKRNSVEMSDATRNDSPSNDENDDGVQHVQLTIRRPQRKNGSKSKCTKTFDQDPTSLRTSYAQSLEKCNFDPNESSTTDLPKVPPKRRFHSVSKKRAGLVSSTPNLNAINHDDSDDDMFVSSAHTSMQQLPTNERRLGILLPTGSRTSFGKGVSFCPVVSKYSWQEQSSEETSDRTIDATVAANKENNNNNNEESHGKTKSTDEEIISEETSPNEESANEKTFSHSERNIENTSHIEETAVKEKITIAISSVVLSPVSAPPLTLPTTISPHNALINSKKTSVNESGGIATVRADVNSINKSPRQVLIASNKLFLEKLDNPRPATPVPHAQSASANSAKMSNYTVKCSASSDESPPLVNNNHELLKSKFKADEKHPQHKGFLSRFANGFRFSLRRNKKKQKQQQDGKNLKPTRQLPPVHPSTTKKSVQNSPDFIYIPLKGPVPANTICQGQTGNGSTPCHNGNVSPSPSNDSNHVLNAKQQFQKPPRVVGVCEKRAQSAGPHAPQHFNPQSMDAEFLDNERSYYDFKNQLNGVMNGDGSTTDNTGNTMDKGGSNYKQQQQHHHNHPQQQQLLLQQQQSQLNHCKIGLIETNLDTHETKISGKTRSLMELSPQMKYNFTSKRLPAGYQDDGDDGVCADDEDNLNNQGCNTDDGRFVGGVKKSGIKCAAGGVGVGGIGVPVSAAAAARRPHKSMEFLLDKENQKNILPPENELQKSHDNTTRLSEHQLRVQASLQRLNIPDWFRQYNHCTPKSPDVLGCKPITNNITRKRTTDAGRWTGLNSKTTSLSSLGSQRSDRSPLLLSPSAHSHHGGQIIGNVINTTTGGNVSGGFSRWSTSYLNSTQTSPSASTRGSFSRGIPINSSFISTASSTGPRTTFRQPYLGWRSQEKLASPRTPHERLASSLLAQRPPKPEQPVTPEIQTSIKEVTSAIVHYVNDQTNRTNQRSRSASPNSRKCWLESSFVGIRPVESPQTPVIENSTFSNTSTGGLSQSFHNNTASATSSIHSGIGLNNVITADGLRLNGVGGESAILI